MTASKCHISNNDQTETLLASFIVVFARNFYRTKPDAAALLAALEGNLLYSNNNSRTTALR